jgi:hypothetical protein
VIDVIGLLPEELDHLDRPHCNEVHRLLNRLIIEPLPHRYRALGQLATTPPHTAPAQAATDADPGQDHEPRLLEYQASCER